MLFSARKSREEQENPRKVQLFSNLPIRDHGCAPIEEFHQLLWLVQSKLSRTWTNQSSWWNSRFGSRNSSIGAQPWSRIGRLLKSWTFLGFSCSSRLLRALNNMYVEGISLGYMEMEILSGLRTSACEGRSNFGVMWGSGGEECAAFASLESV